jgi:type III pantothenate kinase
MLARVLELDVGNTALKWRIMEMGRRLDGGRLADVAELRGLFGRVPAVDIVRVASVASDDRNAALGEMLSAVGVPYRFAVSQSRCGEVVNGYEAVSRMGVDRWLAMVAAFEVCRCACVVVDAGTALTIDILDGSGRHRGGYILPGPEMMATALVGGTDRVRVATDLLPDVLPGLATEACVHNGKWMISLAGVRETVAWAQQVLQPEVQVIVTGGAGRVLCELAAGLDCDWRYIEELVLDGLAPVLATQGGV